MTDAAPITQIGTTVVIQGDAVPLMYQATLALIAHRDGLAGSPLLQQARLAFYRATMSPARHEDAPASPPEASCNGQDGDWIGIAEASRLLRLGRRQTQRLAANGLVGAPIGSIWVLDRSAVLALADERRRSA
jgi:hypothetical protein